MSVADARSTWTFHWTSSALPGTGAVVTTFHTTCQEAGQPKVNQRRVWPAGTVPVNCTPTRIVLYLDLSGWRDSPSEDAETRFDIDRRGGHVGDVDPIGDEALRAPLDLRAPGDLRCAGTRAGGHDGPEDVPVSRPVESEPALGLAGQNRAT